MKVPHEVLFRTKFAWILVASCRPLTVSVIFIVTFCPQGYAANYSLTYDKSGNQSSQQTANVGTPTIQMPAVSQVVISGGICGFSVNVSSVLPVTYQWYFKGVAISGATNDSLLIPNVSPANEGSYTVLISNSLGSATSGPYRLGVDLNGSGLPDSWEIALFGNSNQSPDGDADGDGISNLDEFLNATYPAPGAPGPRIRILSDSVGLFLFGEAGKTYQLQHNSTLESGLWQNLGNPKTGAGTMLDFATPVNGSRHFYRIESHP